MLITQFSCNLGQEPSGPDLDDSLVSGYEFVITNIFGGNQDTTQTYIPEKKAFLGQISDSFPLKWHPVINGYTFSSVQSFTCMGVVFLIACDSFIDSTLNVEVKINYTIRDTLRLIDCIRNVDIHPNNIDDDNDSLIDEEDESQYVVFIISDKDMANAFYMGLNVITLKFYNEEGDFVYKKIYLDHSLGGGARPIICNSLGGPATEYLNNQVIQWPKDCVKTFFFKTDEQIFEEYVSIAVFPQDSTQFSFLKKVNTDPAANEFRIYTLYDTLQIIHAKISSTLFGLDSIGEFKLEQSISIRTVSKAYWYEFYYNNQFVIDNYPPVITMEGINDTALYNITHDSITGELTSEKPSIVFRVDDNAAHLAGLGDSLHVEFYKLKGISINQSVDELFYRTSIGLPQLNTNYWGSYWDFTGITANNDDGLFYVLVICIDAGENKGISEPLFFKLDFKSKMN